MTTSYLYDQLRKYDDSYSHYGVIMMCNDPQTLLALREEILSGFRGDWDAHEEIIESIETRLTEL